jgi:hypothetical protein
MGLGVNVGLLAYWINQDDPEAAEDFRNSIATINEVLLEKGLPQHEEPERLPNFKLRNSCSGFPYSAVHYLRRFYAYVKNDPDWIPTPTPTDEDPADDDEVDTELCYQESHLICHSDCDG